jgi:hypothetical protein
LDGEKLGEELLMPGVTIFSEDLKGGCPCHLIPASKFAKGLPITSENSPKRCPVMFEGNLFDLPLKNIKFNNLKFETHQIILKVIGSSFPFCDLSI